MLELCNNVCMMHVHHCLLCSFSTTYPSRSFQDVFETMIQLIFLYRSECWTTQKQDEKRILTLDHRYFLIRKEETVTLLTLDKHQVSKQPCQTIPESNTMHYTKDYRRRERQIDRQIQRQQKTTTDRQHKQGHNTTWTNTEEVLHLTSVGYI